MIFLRPVIIRTLDDSYRVTVDRYEYLRGYTRGEGPEREGIYDRMEPAVPNPAPLPPQRPAPAPALPASPPAVQPAPQGSSPTAPATQ